MRERRNPAFAGDGPEIQTFGHLNYLWGNIQAIDVLNVGKNEGEKYDGDLDVLFAGQWDSQLDTRWFPGRNHSSSMSCL